ncbi:MAG: TIGR04282 family arsenosugar biosynthesis glycosyltransferase [Balneolaceae bacterium]
MEQTENRLLIVFVKNPEMGRVKTRLAADIGDTEALHIYQKLTAHTRREASEVKADRQVWYSEFIDQKDPWSSTLFAKRLQPGGNLGKKMERAFASGFNSGYGKIVLIGSDCPTILTRHIEEAFEKLESHDTVLGPSSDGGYYLIGLKELNTSLFQDKPWSSSGLYEQTLTELQDSSLSYCELEELNDIDTADDLESVNL